MQLTPAAPQLGYTVPGTTGGMPAKPGLSVFDSPLAPALQSAPQQAAQHTQSFGRGNDSMLVHMTPNEVNSLRGLAQQFGGDLTTNPHTGLPEAGLLGKILPTILGIAGMAFGIPPVWMGALGAVGGTAATGSLSKGLMMGLGAFGGASLGGGLGIAGKLGSVGAKLPGASALPGVGAPAASNAAAPAVTNTFAAAPQAAAPSLALQAPGASVMTQAGQNIARQAATSLAPVSAAAGAPAAGGTGFLSGFGQAAKAGLGSGLAAKAAPMAAGLGLMNAVTPSPKQYKDKNKPSEYGYTGSYTAHQEVLNAYSPAGQKFDPTKFDSSERLWTNPVSYTDAGGNAWTPGEKTTPLAKTTTPGGKTRYVFENDITGGKDGDPSTPYAHGGGVFQMESGGHVFPAKAVAAYGNFDTEAGQRKLAAMGGIPIRGPGDGVSDSIPASIDGSQKARVATGEVYFPPRAVKRLGGNQKLYAMMRKAEHAANRTKSGSKVKGLGALG